MSYHSLAMLQADTNFIRRVAGCAAEQKVQAGATFEPDDPYEWTMANDWEIAATPGFAAAYESAVQTGVPNPGLDQSVISDAQILAAVQALFASSMPAS